MKKKPIFMFLGCMALTGVLRIEAQAPSPYPILDRVAAKVIQKYQTSTCDQLRAAKQQPPTGQQAAMEQKAIEMLHTDADMRHYFLSKVAAPVADKLFQCGMIP
jgi:hypothetical protein